MAVPTAQAAAGINQQINFQGRLLTPAGAVVADGTYNMEFQIWQGGNGCVSGCTSANANTNNGGTLKWTEDWIYGTGSPDNRVTVKNGYYSVSLGSITAFGSNVDWNQDTLWLSMNVGDTTNQASFSTSGGYLIPFKRLSSSVYALQAQSCTSCILQAPTSTAQNTIQATSANVGLTVNAATSGTATQALVVSQSLAADGQDINVSNTGGTAAAGLAITKTGVGGTLTSGISVTQSSGTLTYGITFGGTISTDIKLQNAETIDNATNGTVNIAADSGAVTLKLTGTAATIQNSAGNLSLSANSGTLSLQSNTMTSSAFTFSGNADTISGPGTATSFGIDSGSASTDVNIGGGTSANVNLAGGSSSTGCTIANASGTITCSGSLAFSGTAPVIGFSANGATNGTSLSINGNNAGNGTGGNVSLTGGSGTGANAGGSASIDSGSGTGAGTVNVGNANATNINIGNNNAAHNIFVGNTGGSTGTQAITVGSTGNTANTLVLQGGTNASVGSEAIRLLTSNNGSGAAGNIALTTGTSSSGNASVVVKSGTNSTQALQVVNSSNNQILTVDTSGNTVSLGKSTSVTGILSFLNSGAGSNAFTVQAASGGAAQQWFLPSAIPAAGSQCLQTSSGAAAVTLTWNSCGGTVSLQNAYTGSGAGTATIALTNNATNGISITNSNSNTSSTGALLSLTNSYVAGSNDGLDISSAGTGALLKVTDSTSTSADVLTIADGGAATFKSQTNSPTAFQIQNSSSTPLFAVDTTNGQVNLGIGPTTPAPMGYQTIGASAGSGYNGTINANQFTASYSGSISSMSVYVGANTGIEASPHNTYQVGIYTDSGGSPGTLIAQSSVGTLNSSQSWNTIALSATLSANTKYWLAYWTSAATVTGNALSGDSPVASALYCWQTQAGFGTMPSSYPSCNGGTSTIQHSMYVTYSSTGYGVSLLSNGSTLVNGAAKFQDETASATAFQVQNVAGATLLNVNTNNSNINSYASGALGVTGSAPTNVNEVLQSTYAGTPSASFKDLGVAPHAIGNMMLLTIAIANNTTTVSSIGATNNGGVSNWTLVKSNNYSGWNGTGSTVYMYEGTVTSTGCGTVCSNVRVTFNTTDSVSTEIINQEMTSGLGAGTVWSATSSGSATQTGASTTIPFPTLTSGVSGGLYYGYSFLTSTARIDPGSSGFHWFATPADSNAIGYNLALSPSTSYTPSQLSSANTYANSVGAIITATSDVSLGVNGGLVVAGPGSSAALQVQNSTGAADLNVDTTNHVISLDTGNTGDISPWQYNSDSTGNSNGEGQNVAVAANGYVYDLMGYDNGSINGNSYYAKASSNGQLGHMSTTTAPTTHVVNQGAVVVNGYVYELGGSTTIAGTATVSNVQYAQINSDGTLGTWQTNATALPSGANGVAGASVVAANGYIYVIGGYFNTTMTAAVYYGKVNADGSVSSWTTSANSLPVALRYSSAVYVNGNIIVMGGTTGSGAAVQTVYTASVNPSTGANGAFSSTGNTSLPSARAYASASVINGYVYLVGGSSTDASTSYSPMNSVVYGQINSFGNVTSWSTSAQQLPQAAMWHGGVTMNGYMYVIGGYYTSTPNMSPSVFYASTARVLVGGSLDLIGDSWATLADGGDQSSGSIGGYLTAGNTQIVGTMQVANQAEFNQGVTVNGNFNNFGSTLFKDVTASSSAFQVQNSSGNSILGVDTSANQVLFGATGFGGKLVVYGSTSGAVTLQAQGAITSYNFNLPTTSGNSGDCLKSGGGGSTAMTWGSCGGGGTQTVTLVPEWQGAVFTANSGSGANTGYMQSDNDDTNRHNFYEWSTDQTTAQDYDIVTRYQLPTGFTSFVAGSWKLYTAADQLDTGTTTNTTIKYRIKDSAGTVCYASGYQTALSGSGATAWTQQSLTDPANGCSFSANSTITIDIRITNKYFGTSTTWLKAGELSFQYQ